MAKRLILIGASTGGPGHIQKILRALPADRFAPIVIIQHMQSVFVPTFASSMQDVTALKVRVAGEGMRLESSQIYFCAQSVRLEEKNGLFFSHVDRELPFTPHIDTTFASAAGLSKEYEILSVVLTGIGNDGSLGCQLLGEKGSECLSECETDCPVYGMPRSAAISNPKAKVMHLNDIIKRILEFGREGC